MERESFVFYKSFADAIQELDDDSRLKVYDAIVKYGLHGELEETTGIVKAVITLIKPQIDANNERYLNGCKGGRPKNQTETKEKPNRNQKETKRKPNGNQTKTKLKPNVNVNVNDNENVNVNENVNDNVNENVNDNVVLEKTSKEIVYFPNDEELEKTFRDFIEHRKQLKKPMSDLAIQKMLVKLEKLSGGDNDLAIAILNESIGQGWQGIFPLRDNPKAQVDEMDEFLREGFLNWNETNLRE